VRAEDDWEEPELKKTELSLEKEECPEQAVEEVEKFESQTVFCSGW
jgi:hypothetical protein